MEDVSKAKKSNFLSVFIHSLMKFHSVREFIYKFFLFRPPKFSSNYFFEFLSQN